jgi:hypothetical protein
MTAKSVQVLTARSSQRYNDVINAFNNAAKYFNTQDWGNLQTLLDQHVVLYTIENQTAYVWQVDVMKYFRAIKGVKVNGATKFPNFSPTTTLADPPAYPMKVTGNANWTDYDADDPTGDPELIQYEFIFNPEYPLIAYMFATTGT